MAYLLIDKTHLGWGLGSAAALAVATVGYWSSVAASGSASGGSVAGLTFGVLSLITMAFAGLLAVRKKFPAVRLGSAQFWLRGHIWLGLLSLPLAFFHSGFRFGGTLETVFMIVLLAVIVSGIYGLALQQVLPRFLKVRVPLETFPQQIPFLCQKFQEEGDRLIKELEGPVKKAGPPSAAKAAVTAAPVDKSEATTAATPHPSEGKAAPAADKANIAAKLLAAKLSAAAKPAAAKPATEGAAAAAVPEEGTTPAADKPKMAASALAAKLAASAKSAREKTATEQVAATANPSAEKSAPSAAKIAAAAAARAAMAKTAAQLTAKVAPAAAPAEAIAGPMPRLELLVRFYRDEVFPFLGGDTRIASRQDLVSESYARMAFASLAAALPSQALAAIRRLEEMVSERRQFLVQVRIQKWLRYWLLVHVPLSAALFALAAIHIVTALRVVPWS